ncbi:MAG: response regulator [Patescibacteria group bacterium]
MNDTPTPPQQIVPDTSSVRTKVMFVDDDKFLLDMYTLKFNKAGYDVKTADSTEAALRLLSSGYMPDILLADIVMPDMDGLQFIERVRKERLAPNATIIMLTNQGSSEDIARAKKLEVNGYIVKATTIPSEVLKEVEKICAHKQTS